MRLDALVRPRVATRIRMGFGFVLLLLASFGGLLYIAITSLHATMEAEAKLAEVQKRATEAEAEAKAIVEAARREADQLAAAADVALKERIVRRQKIAEDRISRAESDAIRDVKLAAVDTASKAATAIITEQLAGKAGDDEFAKGLASVTKALS